MNCAFIKFSTKQIKIGYYQHGQLINVVDVSNKSYDDLIEMLKSVNHVLTDSDKFLKYANLKGLKIQMKKKLE